MISELSLGQPVSPLMVFPAMVVMCTSASPHPFLPIGLQIVCVLACVYQELFLRTVEGGGQGKYQLFFFSPSGTAFSCLFWDVIKYSD